MTLAKIKLFAILLASAIALLSAAVAMLPASSEPHPPIGTMHHEVVVKAPNVAPSNKELR